jgi:hypothetical protein
MPTIPTDLSEYARTETGPTSWSATYVPPTPDPPFTLAPTDVLRVVMSPEQFVSELTLLETSIVAAIDGETTLEVILHELDMPESEALTIVCELCAAGVLVAA